MAAKIAFQTHHTESKPHSLMPAPVFCHHQGPVLTQPSWVNLFTLSGLGLSSAAAQSIRRRLVNSVLELPHFDDGVPWNACVDGPSVTWCDMDFKGGGGHPIKAEALSLHCKGGRMMFAAASHGAICVWLCASSRFGVIDASVVCAFLLLMG